MQNFTQMIPQKDEKTRKALASAIADHNATVRRMLPLTYFAPDTDEGRRLAEGIRPLAEELGYAVRLCYSSSASQSDFLFACHSDAVIIVDCTIPSSLEQSTVYPLLTAQINIFDHILVISRTFLPLNITPVRKGGTPNRDSTLEEEDIQKWTEKQLELLKETICSGKHYNRLPLQNPDELPLYREEMEDMLSKSLELAEKQEEVRRRILISYRSRYYGEIMKNMDSLFPHEDNCDIEIIPPNILCADDEAMAPMRMWMLVGMLEEHIRTKDELWIYGTDDYLHSWWTIAELILVSYINQGERKENHKAPITIRYFSFDSDRMLFEEKPAPISLPVVLSETQHRKMARLLSNCRPNTMGPECLKQIQAMKEQAIFLKTLDEESRNEIVEKMRPILEYNIPRNIPEDARREMLSEMLLMYQEPDRFINYANDDVFQQDFWEKLSFPLLYSVLALTICPVPSTQTIDIESFLALPMQNIIDYTPEQLSTIAKKQQAIPIKVNGNGQHKQVVTTVEVFEDKKNPRYLWMATRMQKANGNAAPGLDRIPLFHLKETSRQI